MTAPVLTTKLDSEAPKLFAWLTSPEYQEIGQFRDAGSTAEAIIVKGLEPEGALRN